MADDNIPSPPENPFDAAMTGDDFSAGSSEKLAAGTPNVAAKAGKAFIVVGMVGVAVLFLLYNIFSGDKKKEVKDTPKQIKVTPKSVEPPPLPVMEAPPVLVPPPSLQPPVIPSTALPTPVSVPNINLNPLTPKEDGAEKAKAMARMRSSIMLKEGGAESSSSSLFSGGKSTSTSTPTDANSQFAANVNMKVERVEATQIGDLRRTIAQGRIIQATLESAINTDLPAPIRAIVSRDTYGEAGNTPLIPKGSRLIGSYNTSLGSGQTRVFVVWTRVIRPDGVDVALGSPLVDAIGQAGVAGQVDTKFQQIFARSLLSSVMNIALAIGAEKINGGTTTTTNSAQGGSQTSGDAASLATTNALNRLGSVTDGFIQRFLNVPATILIDQGTPVNVFVNKDLVFPDGTSGPNIVN